MQFSEGADHMNESGAIVWLSSLRNVNCLVMEKLYDYFGSYLAVWDNISEKDSKIGIDKEVIENIVLKRDKHYFEHYMERLYKEQIGYITEVDDEYPQRLNYIFRKPKILYYKGQFKEPDQSIAVVGSRKATAYGSWLSEDFAQRLSKENITVVSGLAQGIDAHAHMGAIKSQAYTMAVIGSGINIQYPAQNQRLYRQIEDLGCVVSEYPLDMPPLRHHFPERNRIISGLSDAVLVVEAKQKSGALITVNYGLEQGKEIMAVPGNINSLFSKGTNKLIQDGAKMVLSYNDVIEYFKGYTLEEKECIYALSFEEESVIRQLKSGPISIDKLAENLKFDIKLLNGVLTLLEIKGIILRLPGSVVQLTKY